LAIDAGELNNNDNALNTTVFITKTIFVFRKKGPLHALGASPLGQ
jgi:hypothetical protein